MLSVFTQRQGLQVEPQACLSYLSGTGAELADQAQETPVQGEARGPVGANVDQPDLVHGFYA